MGSIIIDLIIFAKLITVNQFNYMKCIVALIRIFVGMFRKISMLPYFMVKNNWIIDNKFKLEYDYLDGVMSEIFCDLNDNNKSDLVILV